MAKQTCLIFRQLSFSGLLSLSLSFIFSTLQIFTHTINHFGDMQYHPSSFRCIMGVLCMAREGVPINRRSGFCFFSLLQFQNIKKTRQRQNSVHVGPAMHYPHSKLTVIREKEFSHFQDVWSIQTSPRAHQKSPAILHNARTCGLAVFSEKVRLLRPAPVFTPLPRRAQT